MSEAAGDRAVQLAEGRFARFEAIEWWDQARLQTAKIVVAGAGALGNEVIKNLALMGVGHLVIADMDTIEMSNLSRSVLYRSHHEGASKSRTAAAAAKDIYPDLGVTALHGNLLAEAGLGLFRWADVIIGALDNREARLFLNSAAAQVDRPWLDGGIEVLRGIVRGFAPPRTACYECTMNKTDWDLVNKRRSCSLLARRAIQERGVPTTPTTASVIGAIQAQEAMKLLHGMNDFLGHGYFFDGTRHDSYPITYAINEECEWHGDEPTRIIALPEANRTTPLSELWTRAEKELGAVSELIFSRETIATLRCPGCGSSEDVYQPAQLVKEDQARCPGCGQERTPEPLHSVGPDSPLLARSAAELGLPAWDIVWARHRMDMVGLELSGDEAAVLQGN